MATLQLTLSDDASARIKKQAQKEGITLEAWLTAAILDRLRLRETGFAGLEGVLLRDVLPPERREKRFESAEELQEFWKRCDAMAGPGQEPDWEEHLKNINESRSRGLPEV